MSSTHASSRGRRASLLTALLALTTMVAVTPVADADVVRTRPTPAVWDVLPVPGEIVSLGSYTLAGTALSPHGISSVQISLDGAAVPTVIVDQNSSAARAHATVDSIAVGHHIASFEFVDGSGATIRRDWRFTATDVDLTRHAGADRIATAVTIASRGRQSQEAPAAVLARADDFADALAGAPLAHHLDGPLLLTDGDALSPATGAALTNLVAGGGRVHLLGGTAALSTAVADGVRDLGFQVARHQGSNRYETAAEIAGVLPASTERVVASGEAFPDALSVAAPAAAAGMPILLTTATSLPAATRQALQGAATATIIGGTAAVDQAVADEIDDVVGDVDRIQGADRYETAAAVNAAFDVDPTVVGVANGLSFADALAGAVDVARDGGGLVLTKPTRLPNASADSLRSTDTEVVRIYGGTNAVDQATALTALGAVEDDGPRIVNEVPAASEEINSLDQIQLHFEHDLQVQHTSITVKIDGREIPVDVASGDFPSTLVLTISAADIDPPLFEAIPIRVTGIVRDDAGWTHVDRVFTYRKIAMSNGDSGTEVRQVQQRLIDLGYWLGTPDGNFGSLTVQAIMAFQKYEGLNPSGTADAVTQERLAHAQRPVPANGGGYHIEIDKSRQILMLAQNGTTLWTFNASTGSEVPYNEEGGSGTAITPVGNFTVCREVNGKREADLGTLWRPKYFHCGRGIAVHGATSVPNYPASHGCVRVTYAAMDFIWANDYMPIGATVQVYGTIPPRR